MNNICTKLVVDNEDKFWIIDAKKPELFIEFILQNKMLKSFINKFISCCNDETISEEDINKLLYEAITLVMLTAKYPDIILDISDINMLNLDIDTSILEELLDKGD